MLARMELDFIAEMTWPGDVVIGTRIKALGRSSIHFSQGIFKDAKLCARAHSISVMTRHDTRRSTPLTEKARERLSRMLPAG